MLVLYTRHLKKKLGGKFWPQIDSDSNKNIPNILKEKVNSFDNYLKYFYQYKLKMKV